jgi:hypothetical protein
VQQALENAELDDGTLALNSPAVVVWLAEQGAPAAASRPRRAPAGDVESQIAEIEHVIRTDRRRYNRDENLQARYRTLLSRRSS